VEIYAKIIQSSPLIYAKPTFSLEHLLQALYGVDVSETLQGSLLLHTLCVCKINMHSTKECLWNHCVDVYILG